MIVSLVQIGLEVISMLWLTKISNFDHRDQLAKQTAMCSEAQPGQGYLFRKASFNIVAGGTFSIVVLANRF